MTVNSLSASLAVTEMTLNDPNNGLFSTEGLNPADVLFSHMFTGPITTATGANSTNSSLSDNNPFSVSTEYLITATAAGSVTTTITLSSAVVPEPASLTMLGSALVGLGWLGRRRRKSV